MHHYRTSLTSSIRLKVSHLVIVSDACEHGNGVCSASQSSKLRLETTLQDLCCGLGVGRHAVGLITVNDLVGGSRLGFETILCEAAAHLVYSERMESLRIHEQVWLDTIRCEGLRFEPKTLEHWSLNA